MKVLCSWVSSRMALLLCLGPVPRLREAFSCVLACLVSVHRPFLQGKRRMLVLVSHAGTGHDQCSFAEPVPVLLPCRCDALPAVWESMDNVNWTTLLIQWSVAERLREAKWWANHQRATPAVE